MTQPRDADPLAHPQSLDALSDRIDPADDLVSGDDRQLRVGQFAIDDMEIGSADAARRHLEADLPWSWLPVRQAGPLKRGPEPVQNHCLQVGLPSGLGRR